MGNEMTYTDASLLIWWFVGMINSGCLFSGHIARPEQLPTDVSARKLGN